jgi:hypothetical protein
MDKLLENREDAALFAHWLNTNAKFPLHVTAKHGQLRSIAQNALWHKWIGEAAAQMHETRQEAEAYFKYHIALPILLANHPNLKDGYKEFLGDKPYEKRLQLMVSEPRLPVTSLMNVEDMSEALDKAWAWGMSNEIELTNPELINDKTIQAVFKNFASARFSNGS